MEVSQAPTAATAAPAAPVGPTFDLLARFDAEAAEMIRLAHESRLGHRGPLDRSRAEGEAILSVLRHAKGLRAALATWRQEMINGGAAKADAVGSK